MDHTGRHEADPNQVKGKSHNVAGCYDSGANIFQLSKLTLWYGNRLWQGQEQGDGAIIRTTQLLS